MPGSGKSSYTSVRTTWHGQCNILSFWHLNTQMRHRCGREVLLQHFYFIIMITDKYDVPYPANTRHWPNVVLMLARRLRRRPTMKTTLGQRHVLAGILPQGTRCRTVFHFFRYTSTCNIIFVYNISNSTLSTLTSTTVDILGFISTRINGKPVVKSEIWFQFWNTDICWDLNFANHTNFQSLGSCVSR